MERQVARHIIETVEVGLPVSYVILWVLCFLLLIAGIALGTLFDNAWALLSLVLIIPITYIKHKQISSTKIKRQQLMDRFDKTGELPEEL